MFVVTIRMYEDSRCNVPRAPCSIVRTRSAVSSQEVVCEPCKR